MKEPVTFSKFVQVCENLRNTSSRLEKMAILEDFLCSLQEKDLVIAVRFLLGKPFAATDSRTLDVSWKTIQQVLNKIMLVEPKTSPLTLITIMDIFDQIAMTSGAGSRKKIETMLGELFTRAEGIEQTYLMKIIFGEMQIGVAEGLILESIARAAKVPLEIVRRANMYLGDPAEVARIALIEGPANLEKVRLKLFRPVQPMLAELAEDFSTIFKEHGGKTALEFKFDGARVQIHKNQSTVKIFSRHLSEVTGSLPDVVEMVQQKIQARQCIVEGEVIAVGEEGRPLPFQELMRRFRRVHDIKSMIREVPVQLYLFDLLYLNGESHIDTPYKKRWNLLQRICEPELLVERIITDRESEAEAFLQKSLNLGHEGLMAKMLESNYSPGARGKKWFKIKPAETLDVVIIAADWGTGRRTGWLSNYHLAVRDEKTGEFLMVGKTFKGLTDQEFQWMTEKLQSLKIRETPSTIFVRPELVVEVAYNEIQRSPHYNSKFALRFARIKRIREDKTPDQADTIERLQQLYEKQFERKARMEEKI